MYVYVQFTSNGDYTLIAFFIFIKLHDLERRQDNGNNCHQVRRIFIKYDQIKLSKRRQRIADYKKQGKEVVVVVSAMGKTTDQLLELAGQITDNPAKREMDMLLATGEQVSISLLSMALTEIGCTCCFFHRLASRNRHGKNPFECKNCRCQNGPNCGKIG